MTRGFSTGYQEATSPSSLQESRGNSAVSMRELPVARHAAAAAEVARAPGSRFSSPHHSRRSPLLWPFILWITYGKLQGCGITPSSFSSFAYCVFRVAIHLIHERELQKTEVTPCQRGETSTQVSRSNFSVFEAPRTMLSCLSPSIAHNDM